MRTLLHGRRRLMACPWCPSRCWRWSLRRSTLSPGWTNSADGGPGRRSTLGGGSCTTPLMAWSGGTSPGRAGVAFSSGVFACRCTTTGAAVSSAELLSLFMRQSTAALKEFPLFLARAVHAWKHGALTYCFWVLHEEYRKMNYPTILWLFAQCLA